MKRVYSLGLLFLLAACTTNPVQRPVVRPEPVQPTPIVRPADPQTPVDEAKFSGIVGLDTATLITKVGRPWRIVLGNPEYWHYKVKRQEDGSSADAEVIVTAGRVIDANVDF
jgi:hypothetical protein